MPKMKMKMYPRVFIRRSREYIGVFEVHLLHSSAMEPDSYTMMGFVPVGKVHELYRDYSIERLIVPGAAAKVLRLAEFAWAQYQAALGNMEAWLWLNQKQRARENGS